jgi:hypothetical protein
MATTHNGTRTESRFTSPTATLKYDVVVDVSLRGGCAPASMALNRSRSVDVATTIATDVTPLDVRLKTTRALGTMPDGTVYSTTAVGSNHCVPPTRGSVAVFRSHATVVPSAYAMSLSPSCNTRTSRVALTTTAQLHVTQTSTHEINVERAHGVDAEHGVRNYDLAG